MVASHRLLEFPSEQPSCTTHEPLNTYPTYSPEDDLGPLCKCNWVEGAPRFAATVRTNTLHVFLGSLAVGVEEQNSFLQHEIVFSIDSGGKSEEISDVACRWHRSL